MAARPYVVLRSETFTRIRGIGGEYDEVPAWVEVGTYPANGDDQAIRKACQDDLKAGTINGGEPPEYVAVSASSFHRRTPHVEREPVIRFPKAVA